MKPIKVFFNKKGQWGPPIHLSPLPHKTTTDLTIELQITNTIDIGNALP